MEPSRHVFQKMFINCIFTPHVVTMGKVSQLEFHVTVLISY